MEQKIEQAVQDVFGVDADIQLQRPDPEFGDYTTNVAMQLARSLSRSPRDIADELAQKIRETGEFEAVDVAGPGFINLRLTAQSLLGQAYRMSDVLRQGETVVIETNNPNPFKPMHIGHAYNAVLADTMANLIEKSGATVHRVSYHGDVGAHVGKSMWAILAYCRGDSGRLSDIPESERNAFMGKMYAAGARASTDDPDAAEVIERLSRESFGREDPLYSAIYDTIFSWSFEQIDATVARLGNVPIERRYLESEADAVGVQTVRDNVPAVFTESDGALVFEGSKHGSFDNVFVGSNGRGLYAARDLGLIQLKANDYPDMTKSVIVTGGEQAGYFKGVIAAAELALPKLSGRLVNYPTGLVKLATGKMSSRTGDVITIDWLFEQFSQAIIERGGVPTDEIIAGALRYQFLKVKIGGDVTFDIHEAVSLTGNTGSYLQYAYARAQTVLSKSSYQPGHLDTVMSEDRILIRKLGEYPEILENAMRTLEPHHVCTYLFELAQEFNRYYEKNRVIGDAHEQHRLNVVSRYAETLRAGLAVLGIVAPHTM